jgi:hypothetical protein
MIVIDGWYTFTLIVKRSWLLAALLLAASPLRAVIVSGRVVSDAGQPMPGVQVSLSQVSIASCCHDAATPTSFDGTFQFDVPAAVYLAHFETRTPFYPQPRRIDARLGSQNIQLQMTREPRRYVPDDPPRAGRISVSTPDDRGMTTIHGAPGAVGANHFVVLVNSDTGDTAVAEAGAGGAFEATLFAPPGTSILIKSDPYGDSMRNAAAQAGMNIPTVGKPPAGGAPADVTGVDLGTMAAISGTYVDVPLPPADGGRVAVGGAGGPFPSSRAGLPTWVMRGTLNRAHFNAGETLELNGTITIASPAVSSIDKIGANALLWFERLTFNDGTPAHGTAVQVSSLLTPTGLGIMHGMPPGICSRCTAVTRFDIPRVTAERAEAAFTMQLAFPSDMPPGHYRGLLLFGFSGYPGEDPPSRPQILLDSGNHEGPAIISIGPIRIGSPAAPRLYWTLLTDTLSEGTRGAMPVEDERCCAVTAIIQAPARHLVIPRVHPRTQTPIRYRLEPFALMVSAGDRGLIPPPPAVRFRFPSGRLTVRMEQPDGTVATIGPAPFVQARVTGPIDRNGMVPDPGGLSLHDAYQLTTLDPRFEVEFPSEGPYRISLEGEIEDRDGTTWVGRGTYEVLVGRPLVLDTAVLPGTPFEVGNALTGSVTIVPPVPARIDLRTQLYHAETRTLDRTETYAANRFGTASGPVIRFDGPGEYRVDMTVSHRNAEGRWWFGSRTWGGVVATPSTPVITHGMRGIDDQPSDQRRAWFFRSATTSKLGSGHVHFPFHSGDVTWNQERDAALPRVTFDDREGSLFQLLQVDGQAAAIGEAPFHLSTPGGSDPHFDPSAVELWNYAYRSVQRPAVRIREQVSDSSFLPSLYWRFSDQYGQQAGNGRNGDRPNDFKFQFAASVFRGRALATPQYSIYGSLFVHVPDTDPRGGTRTFPPFQGNGGGPSGGPLFTLKGKDIDLFFHPTGLRPGTIAETGQRLTLAGYSAPTLPSKVEWVLTAPSGTKRTIAGQASAIGYLYDSELTANEPGVWSAKVKILFDGVLPSTNAAVSPPFPAGDVLGSRNGEFNFYVVDRSDPPLPLAPLPAFVRPADGPVTITAAPPPGLSDMRLYYTTTMSGFILEEGSTGALSYSYDAQRLAADFPNLDLYDAEGFGGVDLITISLLVTGTDAVGHRKSFARQVVLRGEEVQVTDQTPVAIPTRRRSLRR